MIGVASDLRPRIKLARREVSAPLNRSVVSLSFAKIPFGTVFAYFFQVSSSLMRLVNGRQTLSPRASELWADDCLKLK